MKLEWLRCYVEIAATGSMNKAAENLYMSQPALTKMMHALENETGEILLYRKKTGVALTKQGEIFAQFARNVLKEYQTYLLNKSACHELEKGYEGVIELVVSSSLLQTYYEPLLEQMREQFPLLRLFCIEADMEVATGLLQEDFRRLGLILCTYEEMAPQWEKVGLVSMAVCNSEVVGCVSRLSKYADCAEIDRDSVPPSSFISIEFAKKSFSEVLKGMCSMRTTNLDMIQQMLIHGVDALVLTPRLVAEEKFVSPQILWRPVRPTMEISFCLVYNQRALEEAVYSPQFLQAFAQTFKRCLQPGGV